MWSWPDPATAESPQWREGRQLSSRAEAQDFLGSLTEEQSEKGLQEDMGFLYGQGYLLGLETPLVTGDAMT